MYGYIYKTTNLINSKIYIGQHKCSDFLQERYYIGSGKKLKLAIKKYGKENFKCELLQECDSLEELNNAEKYWIAYFNSTDDSIGYNISSGGNVPCMEGKNNPFYGKHHSPESIAKMKAKQVPLATRERIRARNKQLEADKSNEEKERISRLISSKLKGDLNPMYGKKHTAESRKLIHEKAQQREPRKQSKAERLKRSNTLKGHSVSEETRKKISETLKAKNKLKSNKEN